MIQISEHEFEQMVQRAVAAIPERFAKHLDNVAFLVADEPTPEQLDASGDWHDEHETLLGLYEGIPLPERDGGYNGVVPDTITVFRRPHMELARDRDELAAEVHETVWHEVAHYFGLDHGAIEELE